MTRVLLMAGAALGVILSGCGSASTGPTGAGSRAGSGASASTGVHPVIDLRSATAVQPVASDTSVPLSPRLYSDSGNPCAGVTVNAPIADVDAACGIPFIKIGSPVVAGTGLIAESAQPSTATVQEGVDPNQATSVANGFLVTEAVRAWAINLGAPKIVPILDGRKEAADALYAAITVKPMKLAYVRRCTYPTAVRVVAADGAVQAHMRALSWPQPGSMAVVASYDQCDGITITFKDGTTTTVLGHAQRVSIVITGRIQTVAPFGPIFVQDGWAPCGPSDLKSVCT